MQGGHLLWILAVSLFAGESNKNFVFSKLENLEMLICT